MSVSWDRRFLDLAKHFSTWSKDPRTKVGAVVAKHRKVVGVGYNGFPRGVADTAERLENRATKLRMVEHAERNALWDAGHDAQGATLYLWGVGQLPCTGCAKGIIQAGIVRVVFDSTCPAHPQWDDEAVYTKVMFAEARVFWDVL